MKISVLYAKPKAKFVPISWLIKLAEFGRISGKDGSHIAVHLSVQDEAVVFDSVAPMSRITSRSRWDEHYDVVTSWDFECNDMGVFPWVLRNTDRPYSRFQCVLIGLGEIFGGWVKKLINKQNPNGSDYLICVEAGARFSSEFLGVKFSSGFDVIGLEEFIGTLNNKSLGK